MQSFVSTLSNQAFPTYQQVRGNELSDFMLEFIQQDYPWFDKNSSIALQELNDFRHRFIEAYTQKGAEEGLKQEQLQHLDKFVAHKVAIESRDKKLTLGEKLADKIAAFGGSWTFIIAFLLFIACWMAINLLLLLNKGFDPYPFILLNLILSCVAALQAPVIMMSQNRQEEKDRERVKNDYMVDLKAELQIRMLHEKIDDLMIRQQEEMFNLQQTQLELLNAILEKTSRQS